MWGICAWGRAKLIFDRHLVAGVTGHSFFRNLLKSLRSRFVESFNTFLTLKSFTTPSVFCYVFSDCHAVTQRIISAKCCLFIFGRLVKNRLAHANLKVPFRVIIFKYVLVSNYVRISKFCAIVGVWRIPESWVLLLLARRPFVCFFGGDRDPIRSQHCRTLCGVVTVSACALEQPSVPWSWAPRVWYPGPSRWAHPTIVSSSREVALTTIESSNSSKPRNTDVYNMAQN